MTLHLVRPGATAVAQPADWIVELGAEPILRARGTPPVAPGPITHDQLVALIAAARRVVTW